MIFMHCPHDHNDSYAKHTMVKHRKQIEIKQILFMGELIVGRWRRAVP